MSLRGFLVIVGITDLLAWGAWGMVLNTVDPTVGLTLPMLAAFYASLFLALLGLCAVIGFGVRVYVLGRDELVGIYVKRTFRQAMLLSLLMIIALWLLRNGWLRWWVLLLVIGALGAWEHFFLTGEQTSSRTK